MLHFPAELSPFIARNKELDELGRLLTNPKCRLVTLVGPGGSGKTRLVIEAAKENVARYADGIFFVALQSVVGNFGS
jgi:predicted ATPase